MYQIKMFTSSSIEGFEKTVNDWLASMGGGIEVISIEATTPNESASVLITILYKQL